MSKPQEDTSTYCQFPPSFVYNVVCFFSCLIIALSLSVCQGAVVSSSTDFSLTNEEFASLVETISEPSGHFSSANYISNETAYLHVVPKMKELGIQSGVYIGVGPEQNFTYIAAIRPKYAFIIDIRRGNLLEHLLFKALFEMANTRQEYLSLLFSKPLGITPDMAPHPALEEMVNYFDRIPGDESFYKNNLQQIKQRITNYGLTLSTDDIKTIQQIYGVFFTEHLNLRWEWQATTKWDIHYPSYREFLLGKDLEGRYGNYLGKDEDFAFIKRLQAKNLIIPVTGDFAGKQALSGIADYIRNRGDVVSAFYLSNVEYYLFPEGIMSDFARNVGRLPIYDRSVLIRAFVNLRYGAHPATHGSHLMTTVLQYIGSFNRLSKAGRYRTYWDVGTADYIQ